MRTINRIKIILLIGTLFSLNFIASGQIDLDLHNALKLGNSTTEETGVIRYNEETQDFEGYDGERWWSLTMREVYENQEVVILEPYGGDTVITNNGADFFGNSLALLDSILAVRKSDDDYPIEFYRLVNNEWINDSLFNFGGHNGNSAGDMVLTPDEFIVGFNDDREVYISQFDKGELILDTILSNTDADFGQKIAYHNGILAVSAYGAEVFDTPNKGRVHLYAKSQEQWEQIGSLIRPEDENDIFFGLHLSMNDNYLIISGAVNTYVYGITGQVISEMKSFSVSGDIAQSNELIAIGSPGMFGDISAQGGVVIIDPTHLTPIDTLRIDSSGYRFGSTVAVSGDRILASGRVENQALDKGSPGRVHSYLFDGIMIKPELILTDPINDPEGRFGRAMQLNGPNYVIASPIATVNGNTGQGKIFIGSLE